jgi:hypothetical protein
MHVGPDGGPSSCAERERKGSRVVRDDEVPRACCVDCGDDRSLAGGLEFDPPVKVEGEVGHAGDGLG